MMQSFLLGFGLLLCAAAQQPDSSCSQTEGSSVLQRPAQAHEADVHKLSLQQMVAQPGGMSDATSLLDTAKAWALADVKGEFQADSIPPALLQSIIAAMNGVINATNISHREDQDEIDRSIAAIQACATTMDDSFTRAGGVNDVRDIQVADGAAHDTCRGQEVILYTTNATKCDSFQAYADSLEPPDCLCPELVAGPSPEMLACLQATATWATSANSTYISKRDQCYAASANLASQKTTCDTAQSTFESAFCSYAQSLTTTCGTYTSCRNAAVSSHSNTVSDVQVSEAGRKAQHQAAKKIICYLGVLNATEADKPTVFATCNSSTYSTTHLDIVYPTVPAAVTCDMSPINDKPCDSAFLSTYYLGKSWSTNAPARACIPCAWAVTTPAP